MDVLALGSVVILKGNAKKVMVVSRAIGIKINTQDEVKQFDYAGCQYPEGVTSQELIFFNTEDIGKVIFQGYKDEINEVLEESIKEWIESR